MNDRKKWLYLHDFHVNVSEQCSCDTPLPDCVTGKLLFFFFLIFMSFWHSISTVVYCWGEGISGENLHVGVLWKKFWGVFLALCVLIILYVIIFAWCMSMNVSPEMCALLPFLWVGVFMHEYMHVWLLVQNGSQNKISVGYLVVEFASAFVCTGIRLGDCGGQ